MRGGGAKGGLSVAGVDVCLRKVVLLLRNYVGLWSMRILTEFRIDRVDLREYGNDFLTILELICSLRPL